MERVAGKDGIRYALVNNSNAAKEGVEAYNRLHADEGANVTRYAKAVVNPGESFVSFGSDSWIDWADAIAAFAVHRANTYMAYDNLPIKAYTYPWAQVEKIHDLSHRVPTGGGEAAICPEDGYMLLDISRYARSALRRCRVSGVRGQGEKGCRFAAG